MFDFFTIAKEESANGHEIRLYAGAHSDEWYAFEQSAFFIISHGCKVCEKGCVVLYSSTVSFSPIRSYMACVRLTSHCLDTLKRNMVLQEASDTFMRFSFLASFGGFGFWKDSVRISRTEIYLGTNENK